MKSSFQPLDAKYNTGAYRTHSLTYQHIHLELPTTVPMQTQYHRSHICQEKIAELHCILRQHHIYPDKIPTSKPCNCRARFISGISTTVRLLFRAKLFASCTQNLPFSHAPSPRQSPKPTGIATSFIMHTLPHQTLHKDTMYMCQFQYNIQDLQCSLCCDLPKSTFQHEQHWLSLLAQPCNHVKSSPCIQHHITEANPYLSANPHNAHLDYPRDGIHHNRAQSPCSLIRDFQVGAQALDCMAQGFLCHIPLNQIVHFVHMNHS